MASHLASCLFHVNDEIVLEAARALGNLTRIPHVLRGMSRSRTDEALILLLGHRSMEVVAAVAGTLVNLSAHAEARYNLLERTAVVGSLAGSCVDHQCEHFNLRPGLSSTTQFIFLYHG